MKAARLVVLTVAIAAGGVAAMLAGRSEKPPEPTPEQKAKIETVDILVAKADIGMGQSVSPQDLQWQTWPASAQSGNFITKSGRPDALESISGSIARAPFVAGEPIREAKLVKAKGSGFMAAILPSGMRAVATEMTAETSAGGFILPNDRVDVILTRRVERRRQERHPDLGDRAQKRTGPGDRPERSRKRTDKRSSSARPRRWN